MGYRYPSGGQAAPFLPATVDFAKKKAKQLQDLVPDTKLSECQEAIAEALGWADWHALAQAISAGTGKSSLPDEDVGEEEARNRWGTQLLALVDRLNLSQLAAEPILATLALTASPQTGAARLRATGPWGRFVDTPDAIAPGIAFGVTGMYWCSRLTPERLAEMPRVLVPDTDGWFERETLGWRVVVSFPAYFSAEEVDDAWGDGEVVDAELCREAAKSLKSKPAAKS
jgi:hypothetical protein